ncbi:MAG: fec operon regulator FecR [Mucilaginibacter sp.]|jgi:transmembrane sensor|nr:fec operon regulator FecR [Mucilaginibacter sp.]
MINDRFIELLTKKLLDEIDENEADELRCMINDEECKKQYNFFKTYWTQDQEQYSNNDLMFRRIKSRIGIIEDIEEKEVKLRGLQRISLFWRSIAAVLLVGICFSVYYYYYYPYFSKAKLLGKLEIAKTPSRVKSRITLSDGSIVTLNSETTLKYPPIFTGQTREVYLDGEAFFDVAKDHKHPFIVHAGKMSVRVLGTAFNIKSYSNDSRSETTLIRGTIEVTLADRPSDRIILKPNEKLILNSATIGKRVANNNLTAAHTDSIHTNYALTNLTYLKSNDTTIVETSWVSNRLIFKDEAFNEIANQMERWYGVKVKFKNENVKDYHFTGVFENESIMQALDALKMIESFNYKYKDETVYIY